MIDTTKPVPQLNMYLALGRAALKEREVAKEREARKQAEERRAQVLQEWSALMDRIEASIPSEFLTCVVEPDTGPCDGLNTGASRGLAYDLAPLGLGVMVAFLTNTVEEGVLWIPPYVTEGDTGEKYLVNHMEQNHSIVKREGLTFYEALAVAAERAEQVRVHNEWITSPKPVHATAPGEAPGDFLPTKGGGFWPVLRVGTNQMEVHALGALDAEAFGNDYGAMGWEDDLAVHTFTLKDVPGFGELYAYVALARVHPRMWRTLMGAQEV